MTLNVVLKVIENTHLIVRDVLSGDTLFEGDSNICLHSMRSDDYIVESIVPGITTDYLPCLCLEVL